MIGSTNTYIFNNGKKMVTYISFMILHIYSHLQYGKCNHLSTLTVKFRSLLKNMDASFIKF